MRSDTLTELEQIGLEAAREVAGTDAVSDVEVEPRLDSLDRPAYYFSVLLDPARVSQGLGLILINLGLKLVDALIARNDEHQPYVRLFDRAGWDQRKRA